MVLITSPPVNPAELVFGIVLIVVLVGLAVFFAARQIRVRRGLVAATTLSPEERGFLIRQTRRRVLCSVLMVIFAIFLAGWFVIEANLPDLKKMADENAAVQGPEPAKAHPLVEMVAYYWILALLVLFGIFLLAGLDFFATARYGMHQKKLLEIERRAALEVEAARLRAQRRD